MAIYSTNDEIKKVTTIINTGSFNELDTINIFIWLPASVLAFLGIASSILSKSFYKKAMLALDSELNV